MVQWRGEVEGEEGTGRGGWRERKSRGVERRGVGRVF